MLERKRILFIVIVLIAVLVITAIISMSLCAGLFDDLKCVMRSS
jgi:uncharacterized membrane protein